MGAKQSDTGVWCPPGWARSTFRHDDHEHAFYVVDRSHPEAPRPSVLLLHEFPGISDSLVALAEVLAEDFRVVVPSIFGRDGSPAGLDSLRQICVRREVHVLSRQGASRSVAWLRPFVDEQVAAASGRPYGVIGMCFTGNFALALAIDPRVRAAVLAQPATPVAPAELGLSHEDRNRLGHRVDLEVRGYRFACDPASPAAKLTAAEELLGERMRSFALTDPDPGKHSTLTGRWRSEEAIAAVRAFLRERLGA